MTKRNLFDDMPNAIYSSPEMQAKLANTTNRSRINESFSDDELNIQQKQMAPVKKRLCKSCGSKLQNDFSFCPYCGTKVKTEITGVL